jgi:hypothetical protein
MAWGHGSGGQVPAWEAQDSEFKAQYLKKLS